MYVLIYVHMLSVLGPYMSENSDTKVSRHTKNHVAKFALSGRKSATFRNVADMSPTCCRHFQPRWVAVSDSYKPLELYKLIESVVLKQTKDQYPVAVVWDQYSAVFNAKQ